MDTKSIPNLYSDDSLKEISKLVSSKNLMTDDDATARTIRLPDWLWGELDREAKECKRSSVKQLEAVMTYYYRGAASGLRLDVLDGMRGSAPADALLLYWQSLKSPNLDSLVFPHKTYKKAWDIIRTNADIPQLRLRDLRRDWVTRLAKRGYSDRLAQHGAGHARMQQTFDYTVFDYEAAIAAKTILDE